MHWMQGAVLEPPLLDVVPLGQQGIEAGLFIGEPSLDGRDLLADLVDLFVDDLDLDVGATFLLDDKVAFGSLVEQAPVLVLKIFLVSVHGVLDLELLPEMLLELVSLLLNFAECDVVLEASSWIVIILQSLLSQLGVAAAVVLWRLPEL